MSLPEIPAQPESSEPSRERELWFRALAETTATAIMVFDATRVLYVNRAASELTGYSNAELLALPPWQMAPPEQHGEARERMLARMRGEGPHARRGRPRAL